MTRKLSRVDYSRVFAKQLKKAPLKIKEAFRKRREIFFENPFNPQLNNHQLTGDYKEHRSINITGDWRVIFTETLDEEDNKTILFKFIGTHSQLYRR